MPWAAQAWRVQPAELPPQQAPLRSAYSSMRHGRAVFFLLARLNPVPAQPRPPGFALPAGALAPCASPTELHTSAGQENCFLEDSRPHLCSLFAPPCPAVEARVPPSGQQLLMRSACLCIRCQVSVLVYPGVSNSVCEPRENPWCPDALARDQHVLYLVHNYPGH